MPVAFSPTETASFEKDLRANIALRPTSSQADSNAFAQLLPVTSIQEAKQPLSAQKMQQIDQAARQMEAMFLGQMLQPMFSTVSENNWFSGGAGEKAYRGLLVEEYGKALSENGGIGLAQHIRAEMIRRAGGQ